MDEEGSIVCRLCRTIRWRRYQRLPPVETCSTSTKRPACRGIRLGRRRLALGLTAWRLERRRVSWERWWSQPQLHLLVTRLVDTCINSVLLRPLKAVRGFSSPAEEGATTLSPPPSKLLRRADSSKPRRGKEFDGERGVMLNICVAEVLMRRSSSQVRSSPLQVARKAARSPGALASGARA